MVTELALATAPAPENGAEKETEMGSVVALVTQLALAMV